MACHTNVSARHEAAPDEFAPITEVSAKVQLLLVGKHGEPWQRIAVAAAYFRRQSPDTAASGAQLRQFFLGEFQNPVGRVGANSVKRLAGAVPQPFKAVRLFNPVHWRLFQL